MLYHLCFFLRYGKSKKRYCCFDPISHKWYVSHYVYFLEHIPFFSIPTKSHNVFKSKLVHIDHFLDDIDSFLANTSTLVPGHHAHPPTAIPTLSGTVNSLPPHFSQYLPKSTRLLDFVYSFYSDSFTSFLTSIHNLSKPLWYQEAIIDPLW